MLYQRECPRCLTQIVHETEYDFKAANRSKRVCPTCLDAFCLEHGKPVGSLTRQCPRCTKPIYYGNFRGKKYADEDNRACKLCADESTREKCREETWRSEHSKTIGALWADENSVFNTKEFRAALVEGQLSRTDNKSVGGRKAWESRTEESKRAFIENAQSAAAKAKRSASHLKLRAEEPERWQTEKAKAGWAVSGEKGKTYIDKAIAAARLNGKRSAFERSLEGPLSQLGFSPTKQVGKWWVDYLNEETKVVVEAYGDWYHGHLRFEKRVADMYGGVHPEQEITLQEIRAKDLTRKAAIEALGYTVIVIWQYDARKWLRWIEESLRSLQLSSAVTYS